MEVKIPGVQMLRKRSDRGDLISASTDSKLLITINMNHLWKASLQQATQSGMMTVLGLLKSGKLISGHTNDRSDLMKLFWRTVRQARPDFSHEEILKNKHEQNKCSLETMQQNWKCQ